MYSHDAAGILSDFGLNKAIHRVATVSISDTGTQDLPGAGQWRHSTGRAETLQDLDELAGQLLAVGSVEAVGFRSR